MITFFHRYPTLAVVILWLGLEIPFLPTAFRIDEPYYLAITRQVLRHPGDPYGFQINWLGTPKQVSETFANPPLVPYWVAAWACLLPWNEWSIHAGMLFFGLVAIHALAQLARCYRVDPSFALFLLCFTPAFFLGSQVVMLDVPMLSLVLLAVAYALTYQETGQKWAWGLAFTASFFCPLAKYNGLLVVPLLMPLIAEGRRRIGILVLTTAPIGALVIWNLFTWVKYGRPNVLLLFDLQRNLEKSKILLGHEMGILVASGLGATALALPVILSQLKTVRKSYGVWIPLVFVSAFFWARYQVPYPPVAASLVGVGVSITLMLTEVALRQLWKYPLWRDPRSTLLVLWFILGLLMQFGLAATSVRYTLIIAPPAILIVLKLLKDSDRPPAPALSAAALLLSVLLSLSIAIGDAQIADGYRQIVWDRIAAQAGEPGSHFYFAGHWGLHYYAEQAGGIALDTSRAQRFERGDRIVVAQNAWPGIRSLQLPLDQKAEMVLEPLSLKWPVNTITCEGRANFYGNRLAYCDGPTLLPFAVGHFTSEVLHFYKILGPAEALPPASLLRQEFARPE